MRLQEARQKNWQFGPWTLDAPSLCLIDQSQRINITTKMQDVLLVLLLNAQRPVKKEDIYAQVWPDVVVSEQLIARAISDLRKVLSDNSKSPIYIETLPKVGYRWKTAVSEVNSTDSQILFSSQGTQNTQRVQRKVWIAWSLSIIAIVLGGVWFYEGNKSKGIASQHYKMSAISPLTSATGTEDTPTISPDGKTLAYAHQPSDGEYSQIVLKDIQSQQVVAILPFTKDQRRHQFAPRFSPDGKSLAFTQYSQNNADCGVYIVNLQKLDAHTKVSDCASRFWMPVDWTPDGKSIVYTQETANNTRALYQIHISTGKITQISFPSQSGTSDYSPKVSPNGDSLAFVRGQLKPSHHSAIYTLNLVESSAQQPNQRSKMRDSINIFGLTWLSENEILYVEDSNGKQSLRVMNLESQNVHFLENGNYHQIDFHIPTSRLVYAQSNHTGYISQLDLQGHSPISSKPIIQSTRNDKQARISPSGKHLAFISDRSSKQQVWLGDAKGQNLSQLSQFLDAQIVDISWSPDSQYLLVNLKENGNVQLYQLEISSKKLTAIAIGQSRLADVRWSNLSQWLIGSCNREGVWYICRLPSKGGEPEILLTAESVSPFMPHHSDFIYYTQQKRGLWRMPFYGNTPELVWEDFPEHSWRNWVLYENQLFYFENANQDNKVNLRLRDLITGMDNIIYSGQFVWDENSMNIDPDGTSLYFTTTTKADDDIYTRQIE
jgi:Tol biopolymer transport system component/DNA-binding winged helix-turn-helix (wHTH) protein